MLRRILLHDPAEGRWLRFEAPHAVHVARRAADVRPLIEQVEREVRGSGRVAAGFLGYEAAPGFDAALETQPAGELPLALFGVFDRLDTALAPVAADEGFVDPGWAFDTAPADYASDIARIREEIAAGGCYQVNYTMRARTSRAIDPFDLFQRIAGDAPFAAYVECDDYAIVSASPELFFRLDGTAIESRPMKGTAPRGLHVAADRANRRALEDSAKDRAENVMIADMIRNDLGKIAEPGSVRADRLFEIERYPTVWQATSTIRATTSATLAEIFTAMFPCASITGAPKVASMRLIRQLERSPRGVYSGAIGWLAPERQATFSVAIRTAVVDRRDGRASYGVGGGIVWDSRAGAEYEECRAKTRVLRRRAPQAGFGLLETLRWRRGEGFYLLERHLERLGASAEYFGFRFEPGRDMSRLRARLDEAVPVSADGPLRVRVVLGRDGSIEIATAPLEVRPPGRAVRVRLARSPVDPNDLRLYHKTTDRRLYEGARAAAGDCDDVLLWTADGFVTEATIANLLCRFGTRWVTPPVDQGLLGGTARAELLDRGLVCERPLRVSELAEADELCLVNGVRGRYPVELVGPVARRSDGRAA